MEIPQIKVDDDTSNEQAGRAPQSEPLFAKDPIAEQHSNDSSSMAPSRAEQPRIAARSFTVWALVLMALAGVAAIVFMVLHPHPVDDGKIRGPGDEASPNAPSDYKRR